MAVNETDLEVLPVIADRWSPYRFDGREVEDDKLRRCLEAARWAASSFNDQPWSWIVARRQDGEAFEAMLQCLLEANRDWASRAGVLICTVIRTNFSYNQKPNRVALHDLGAAAAQMSLQATSMGLQVHQMAGVNLSQVRGQYQLPEGYEPATAIAIGYADEREPNTDAEQVLEDRQSGVRERTPLKNQVFMDVFGQSAPWL
ncbi:nitroreductase family protein [Rhodopirellula baltica SH28]|uniref:Nitroreductase family protein n=1 Tax=Rhodopirellula baltica SH28 TaxID=993517 RepID=K5EB48_RHOBT|nr:nitroreductase family protein [Rhodopirellula baltica]EKK03056.1 nitroreductase family protein [Rhodopirellula baltica SH28]